MSLKSRETRRLALVGLTALAALGGSATTAQASFQKTLVYSCTYPYVGVQPLKVDVDVDLPAVSPAGSVTPQVRVNAVATALGDTGSALDLIGVKSIEGKANAKATLLAPNVAALPIAIGMNVAKQSAVGSVANGVVLNATGSTPGLLFKNEGVASVTLDSLALNLTARKADGTVTIFLANSVPTDSDANPETFDVPCTLQPGQSKTLAAVTVGTGAPQPPDTSNVPTIPAHPANDTSIIDYGYDALGTATLKTLVQGYLTLRGEIDADLGLPSGNFTADLGLNQTKGNLMALGLLPVAATVQIVPTEKVTGTLKGGVLRANAKVRIKLPYVTLFGIPVGGGANCQAKNISGINLKSTQPFFYALEGGPIAGTFSISELVGCGGLNGIISPLTAGQGNAILLNLAPKK